MAWFDRTEVEFAVAALRALADDIAEGRVRVASIRVEHPVDMHNAVLRAMERSRGERADEESAKDPILELHIRVDRISPTGVGETPR
ncbi:MAG: hypothetical protein EPO09_21710 [Aquabacterium sp.]|uniref:hypothetical protein n=1 Tax=Aquabacterium sp. TaxID=1872578 RepID=UPI001206A8BC|nr:hypothetical protein [Aquabacterium sp.]TAK82105.1 MAG: hypothetical protein EPO09_21710 [Aquabacterium sp.]